MTRKEKLKLRLPLIFGFAPFFATGIDALQNGDALFAGLNLLMASLNLGALFFVLKSPLKVNFTLMCANAPIAFAQAYLYFEAGKKALPYTWVAVGCAWLIGAMVFYWRSKKKQEKAQI